MTDDDLLRYSRHLLLEDIGIEGQARIAAAHALVIGAGGLGSPVALFLGSAGVGRITLVDGDKVDLTNLQRQVLYTTASVGKQKTEEAKKALASLNPEVDVQVVSRKLQQDELEKLVPQASVVLDCSDNFATRHAVNRACVRHRKPLVSGAAIRFDAQLMVFDLRRPDAPCYACLFPEDGEVEEVQCSTMGVFAPLTGVIGALQAMEAIKLVAGVGESSAARIQVFDAKSAEWRSVKVPKDSACAVCSAAP
jgi:adenylyltransferase/sulfurtransferase